MQFDTLYLIISLTTVITLIVHIINMLYFKFRGVTIFRQRFNKNSIEFKKLSHAASTRGLAIASTVTAIASANLAYDIHRILHFNDPNYIHFALIYLTPFVLILSLGGLFYCRKYFSNY